MATLPTHDEKAATVPGGAHAAEDKRAAAAPLTPAGINLLLARLATDWLIGDKHHYAEIRAQVLRLLTDLGADGAEAKARLEGMSGAAPPVVVAPTAKAA